ncbi:MAG: hypothetical protein HOV80_36130 [Polyangiaceae bacterium]|nr:hypothetical protein [Polyangiaceae bacterium]
MSPEERREVLEQLLARVRQTVAERGLSTPIDLPPRSMRPPPAEVAHLEHAHAGDGDGGAAYTSGGFHEMETAYAEVAPVVLESAMRSAPPPAMPPPPPPPVSRPLVRFEFEDEITATGDPGEIEAMVLAEAVAADAEGRVSEPPLSGPSTVPPAMQAHRYEERQDRRSVPLELEDLDSLGAPPPVTPSDAPPAPVVVPPLPKFEPPPMANLEPLPSYELEPSYEPASPTSVDAEDDDEEVIQLDAEDLASVPPEPAHAEQEEAGPETEHAGFVDRISIDDIEAAALPEPEPELPPYVPPPAYVEPPPYVEPPAYVPPPPPPPDLPPVAVEAEAIPESQRQPRALDRPIDDVIEGIDHDEEPPPESGEVESQRYPAAGAPIVDEVSSDVVSAEAMDVGDDAPTPKPVFQEQTAETRSIGAVDVIDRPPTPDVQVTQFSGSRPRFSNAFGDLLDQALSLGE